MDFRGHGWPRADDSYVILTAIRMREKQNPLLV
jgi:hypothetical protein